jgi:HK97 family phage portal protein
MRFAALNPIRAVRALFSYLTQRIADRRFWVWGDSSSGVQISHEVAMQFAVFARCVAILAGDISCLGMRLFRRRADGGKEEAFDHPDRRYWTLAPNAYQSHQRWMEFMVGCLVSRGNSCSEIEWQGGRLAGLHPIDARQIECIGLVEDKMIYRYAHPTRGQIWVNSDQVLHLRGYTEDGLVGVPVLRMVRNALGLGIAEEQFGASLFKNQAVPRGCLSYPGVLSDDDFEAIKQTWQRNQGGENSNRFAILDRGLTWQSTGISPNESQFLESRKFQRAEIAGWFGVPLHRLNDLEKLSFNNVEQIGIDYVTYTLLPWLVRIEQEINRVFYPDGQVWVSFSLESLLRGDLAARANYYKSLFGMGVLTINEIRHREGLNAIGPLGDINWMPLNVAPAQEVLSPIAERQAPALAAEYLQKMLPHLPLVNPAGPPDAQVRSVLLDAARRVTRKEVRAVCGAIDRYLASGQPGGLHAFVEWGNRFYAEQRQYFLSALAPASGLLAVSDLERRADQYVRGQQSRISDNLLETGKLRAMVAAWDAEQPAAIVESLEH